MATRATDFLEYAKSLHEHTLLTDGQQREFTVGGYDGGLVFTPSDSKHPRRERKKFIEAVLSKYDESGSLRPIDYQSISRNASYLLAILKRFLKTTIIEAPPEVRVLALNRDKEFKDCGSAEDVQQRYFLNRLPFEQDGWYYYRLRGLDAKPGTIVLFQCDSSIIASAVFRRAEESDEKGYGGRLLFDVGSILVFDAVDIRGMKNAWPDFKRFSRGNWLDPHGYPVFRKNLKGRRAPYRRLSAEEGDPTGPGDGGAYSPGDTDSRPTVERQIRERRGQASFRNGLCERYGSRCMVTGSRVLAILEAAHIIPYRGEEDNHRANGLLLRADIHTLFDLDLLGIEPNRLRVELHPDVAKEYGRFAGRLLKSAEHRRPSRDALQKRYERFRARLAEDDSSK